MSKSTVIYTKIYTLIGPIIQDYVDSCFPVMGVILDNQKGEIVDYLSNCIFDHNTSDKENLMAWLDDFEVGDNHKPEDWSQAKRILRFVSDDD